MFLSGIADEAGESIEKQIMAHKELGWHYIEIRGVDKKNLTDVSDAVFEKVYEKVEEGGMKVSCFASQIANWSRKISGDFSIDVEELKRAIPRMHCLKTKFIRIMSYANDNYSDMDWRNEAVKRLRKLAKIAEDNDIILAHENCAGWGGLGPNQALDIIEAVDSPAFRFLIDTGNKPHLEGSAYDIFRKIKKYVVYCHIKDYKGEKGDDFTFPGEGDCNLPEIITELLRSGYKGGFSIEPHMASVIHLGKEMEDKEAAYNLYIEYGKRFNKLMEKISENLFREKNAIV